MHGWPTGVHTEYDDGSMEANVPPERTILATWLLMGQTLIQSEPLDAPTRKWTPASVSSISAAPAPHPRDTTDDRNTGSREYSVSWWVRGLNRTSRIVVERDEFIRSEPLGHPCL